MRKLGLGWVVALASCGVLQPNPWGRGEDGLAPAPPTIGNDATFENATGPGVPTWISYCGGALQPACTSGDPVQVIWGQAANAGQRSGLGYNPADSQAVSLTGPFVIGSLTHSNFPVYSGTGASGVRLALQVRVDPAAGGAALFNERIEIDVTIDETLNEAPCFYPSASPCADAVSLASNVTLSYTSTVAPYTYTLDVLGFNTTPDGAGLPVTQFLSEEGGANTAYLIGRFRLTCDDADSDGVCDSEDNCPTTANAEQVDADGDGVGDACDNCAADSNSDQADADSDGQGDVCEPRALCDMLAEMNIHHGTATSLCAKARAAENAENGCTAANILSAFQHEVDAQTGKKLTGDQAAELNARAAALSAERCP